MPKRTEITIETSRRLIVRRSTRGTTGWCDQCLAQVEMITPNEAAIMLNVSSRAIYRWVEEACLHFTEDAGGTVLICAASLGAGAADGSEPPSPPAKA